MSNWDWDWILKGSGLQPEDFMPTQAPRAPSPTPTYSSASQVPLSAYGPPATIQDPNAPPPPDTGTPTADGVKRALEGTEYGQDIVTPAATLIARLGGGDQSAVEGVEGVSRPYLTGPLAAGAAVAGMVSDINQRTPPAEAILGNAARQGLVYGAGDGGRGCSPRGRLDRSRHVDGEQIFAARAEDRSCYHSRYSRSAAGEWRRP